MQNPKTIVVIGRRWFRKGPGTTYHSAEIHVDGQSVEGVDYAYGYGEEYLHSAFRKLQKDQRITPLEPNESPWRWAERNGVQLTYSATDVERKKDL